MIACPPPYALRHLYMYIGVHRAPFGCFLSGLHYTITALSYNGVSSVRLVSYNRVVWYVSCNLADNHAVVSLYLTVVIIEGAFHVRLGGMQALYLTSVIIER